MIKKYMRAFGRFSEFDCGGSGADTSPRQLPQRKQDAQLVVKLQEVIKSSEEELRLSVTFSLEPHHIRLKGQVLTD